MLEYENATQCIKGRFFAMPPYASSMGSLSALDFLCSNNKRCEGAVRLWLCCCDNSKLTKPLHHHRSSPICILTISGAFSPKVATWIPLNELDQIGIGLSLDASLQLLVHTDSDCNHASCF
jgi:hypothetical protein